MSASVPVLTSIRDVASRYDVLLSDVWGVVHDGRTAYAGAGDAFARFRAVGGTVLLLSNAPMPSDWVARVLDEKGVRRDSWDAIVSSGDMTLAHVIERGFGRVHHIGTPRDLPLLDKMPARRVPLGEAEAIVCTGLVDDRNETAESYRPLLEIALSRRLPLLCANPDLIVDVGGELLLCAGVIGELYEAMGGPVFWGGKPHLPVYHKAMETVARLRGAPVLPARVLAIGDAVRTDIAGAAAFGIDSLFIGQGIHRDEVLRDGSLDAEGLSRLLAGQPRQPLAAMVGVVW
jgi:HAD superfamily hydrolase (TIGR01459 family)